MVRVSIRSRLSLFSPVKFRDDEKTRMLTERLEASPNSTGRRLENSKFKQTITHYLETTSRCRNFTDSHKVSYFSLPTRYKQASKFDKTPGLSANKTHPEELSQSYSRDD